MFICECGYGENCNRRMPVEVYDTLKAFQPEHGDDYYIVHKDHIEAGDREIQREGEWVLVRVAAGGSNE